MQVTRTTTGGIITYDSEDFRAGFAPQGGISSFMKYAGTNGFATGTRVDPFSTYGTLTAGLAPSSASTGASLVKPIVAMEMTDNSTGIGVDAGGVIQQLTTSSSTVAITNAGVFPHTITGTLPVGQDGIIYRHNYNSVSTISFFYSYYNNANWNIGVYRISDTSGAVGSFDSATDNFMSARPLTPLNLTTDGNDATQLTAPHPMSIGADGILYIGSGRYLHAYDGNTGATYGTFFNKVLTLPQGTQIIAIQKYKNILLIACNYYSLGTTQGTGQALLYTWDYTSLDILDVTNLEDFYVSALFIWKGNPTVITSGLVERNGTNKVKVISGNSVTKVADYYDGGQPTNRGVIVANNILYINSGGYITTIGDRYTRSFVVNNVALLDGSNPGYSGVLLWNQLRSCLMGSTGTSTGTSPSFHNLDNGHSNGEIKYPFFFPPFPEGKKGTIKYVEVEFFTPNSGNGTVTMTIDIDNGSATYLVLSADTISTLPMVKRKFRTTSGPLVGASFGSFTSIRPSITWGAGTTSPQISRISIGYNLLEVTN